MESPCGSVEQFSKPVSSASTSASEPGSIVVVDGDEDWPVVYDLQSKPSSPMFHRYKTLLCLVLLSCAWLTNDVVLAWVHERVPYQSGPLPDIWFSIFPEHPWAIKLTEAVLVLSLLSALSIMMFHQHRWLVTRRVLFISSLCYFGRAFCITLTQVPVPSRSTYCAPIANATTAGLIWRRVGGTISGLGMDTLLRPRELCGDLIYSGHTTILCLCCLTVLRYTPKRVTWIRYVSVVMTMTGVIGILMARKHYTLDVVLAYYVTTRVYWIYHTLADHRSALFSSSIGSTTIANVFWSPIVVFLESDVTPGALKIADQPDSQWPSLGMIAKRILARDCRQKKEQNMGV